jgi:hypothetical protein
MRHDPNHNANHNSRTTTQLHGTYNASATPPVSCMHPITGSVIQASLVHCQHSRLCLPVFAGALPHCQATTPATCHYDVPVNVCIQEERQLLSIPAAAAAPAAATIWFIDLPLRLSLSSTVQQEPVTFLPPNQQCHQGAQLQCMGACTIGQNNAIPSTY